MELDKNGWFRLNEEALDWYASHFGDDWAKESRRKPPIYISPTLFPKLPQGHMPNPNEYGHPVHLDDSLSDLLAEVDGNTLKIKGIPADQMIQVRKLKANGKMYVICVGINGTPYPCPQQKTIEAIYESVTPDDVRVRRQKAEAVLGTMMNSPDFVLEAFAALRELVKKRNPKTVQFVIDKVLDTKAEEDINKNNPLAQIPTEELLKLFTK